MSPGLWFRFPLGEGRAGGGQVIAVAADAVAVRLCGAVWDCEPGLLDLSQEPIALDHVVLPAAVLAQAVPVGQGEVPAEAAARHDAWLAGGGAVVHAPLAALMAALLLD
ncbi:MAG: hypothetical protein H6702_06675 [Myxococcales bacterium]|nr:hypothetical protein [Myxococcales bacterium]